MQAAEQPVEQIAERSWVAITMVAPALVVLLGWWGVGGGDEGPEVAGGGKSVVFDLAVGNWLVASASWSTLTHSTSRVASSRNNKAKDGAAHHHVRQHFRRLARLGSADGLDIRWLPTGAVRLAPSLQFLDEGHEERHQVLAS